MRKAHRRCAQQNSNIPIKARNNTPNQIPIFKNKIDSKLDWIQPIGMVRFWTKSQFAIEWLSPGDSQGSGFVVKILINSKNR